VRSVSPSSVGTATETYVFLGIGRNPSLGENRTGIRGLDKTLINSKPVRTIENEPWGTGSKDIGARGSPGSSLHLPACFDYSRTP